MNVNEAIARWSAVLMSTDLGASLQTTFSLKLLGEQGGRWFFQCYAPVTVDQIEKPVDCEFELQGHDFIKIVQGGLNPQAAFHEGLLKVHGDSTVALKLHPLWSIR